MPATSDTEVTAIAHVIQLSVAPVFLLSGIAGLLAVLAGRLGRIVDRARQLEERDSADVDGTELKMLSRRAHLCGAAITLCTGSALLVALVIMVLFLGAFLRYGMATTVAIVFVLAMFALCAGLLVFLREIFLATATLRIGGARIAPAAPPGHARQPQSGPQSPDVR
jgi:small-conductance mechanosensitive channel